MTITSIPTDIRDMPLAQAVCLVNLKGNWAHKGPALAGRWAWEQALQAGRPVTPDGVEARLNRLMEAGAMFDLVAARNVGQRCREDWIAANSPVSPLLRRIYSVFGTGGTWFLAGLTALELYELFGWEFPDEEQKRRYAARIKAGYFSIRESGAPILTVPLSFCASRCRVWHHFVAALVEGAALYALGNALARVRMSNRRETCFLSRSREIPVPAMARQYKRFIFGVVAYVAWLDPGYGVWHILTVPEWDSII